MNLMLMVPLVLSKTFDFVLYIHVRDMVFPWINDSCKESLKATLFHFNDFFVHIW